MYLNCLGHSFKKSYDLNVSRSWLRLLNCFVIRFLGYCFCIAKNMASLARLFLVLIGLTVGSCEYNRFVRFEKTLDEYQETGGKKWVLLIAGSRFYYNYRHQV